MLSVVITAWNEEKNLPRAVRSVSDIADEIVVVDTESTDKTAKVAKDLGCQVFHHQHTRYVEPVRNFSIGKAKGDWILLLDADEEVPLTLADEIKKILKKPTADYYRLPRKNLIFGQWVKSAHWWPDYVYRLFKKGAITWQPEIHSLPITHGRGADLAAEEKLALVHHHYDSIFQYVDRLNRYTDIQVEELVRSKAKFNWVDIVAKPVNEFLTQYFARQGFKEGLHGLALALLQSFSAFVLYLKLWQKSGFPDHHVTPDNLKSQISNFKKDFKWWYYQAKIDTSPFFLKPFWKLVRKLS